MSGAPDGLYFRIRENGAQVFRVDEPTVESSVRAGADLTLFSGDKLFGGPQAGIIVGRRQWIEQLRACPIMRAVRVDKLTLDAVQRVERFPQRVATLVRRRLGDAVPARFDAREDVVAAFRSFLGEHRPPVTMTQTVSGAG